MLLLAGHMGCSAVIVCKSCNSSIKSADAQCQNQPQNHPRALFLLCPGDLQVCRICVFLQQQLVFVQCANTFWEIQSRRSLIRACWRCPLIGHFEDLGADAHYINRKLTETRKQLGSQSIMF